MSTLISRSLYSSKLVTIAIVTVIIILSSCGMPNVGVKKDLNTGLSTSYSGIAMEDAAVLINDQEIHNNNIPLGKSFTIVNKNVSGLAEKDGKLFVGCSLLITDEKGNKILDEADLFKDKEGILKEEGKFLYCKVNTGEPMQTGKTYNVLVRFWDKSGPGKIENNLAILMVD